MTKTYSIFAADRFDARRVQVNEAELTELTAVAELQLDEDGDLSTKDGVRLAAAAAHCFIISHELADEIKHGASDVEPSAHERSLDDRCQVFSMLADVFHGAAQRGATVFAIATS